MQFTSISEREKEIVDNFSLFDDWEGKYEYLIDLGKKLEPLDDKYRKEENIIKGCQSTVWLVADYRDGRIFFKADSDAIIVRGLVSMLIEVLSGQTPEDVLSAKMEFIKEIGMMQHLAQTRSNGLVSMIKQMKNYAIAFHSIHS
ncbi:MAG: SufE family protein [Chitinophagaceae bacterium]|nr:SufE family protein [Chitinophagaceae bacterium]